MLDPTVAAIDVAPIHEVVSLVSAVNGAQLKRLYPVKVTIRCPGKGFLTYEPTASKKKHWRLLKHKEDDATRPEAIFYCYELADRQHVALRHLTSGKYIFDIPAQQYPGETIDRDLNGTSLSVNNAAGDRRSQQFSASPNRQLRVSRGGSLKWTNQAGLFFLIEVDTSLP